MKFHPAAEIFPRMSDEAIEELGDDIFRNQLQAPIEILKGDGRIIDGRNRYLACEHVGVEPEFVEVDVSDPVSYVMSLNLHRRHLTPSQKAAVAVDVEKCESKLAKERQKRKPKSVPEIFPEQKGESREKAAEVTGANPRYVSDAKKIAEEDPEVFEEVRSGAKTIPQAKREIAAKKEPESESAEVVTDKAGRTVPGRLKEHHGLSVALDSVAREFDSPLRKLNDYSEKLGGEFLDQSALKMAITALKREIRNAAYYTHCPRCSGRKKSCELCSGNGFVPKGRKGYMTKEEQELCN